MGKPLEGSLQALEEYLTTPEAEAHFRKHLVSEPAQQEARWQHWKPRFLKTWVASGRFDEFMNMMKTQHGPAYKEKCRAQGYEPCPNTNLYDVIKLAEHEGVKPSLADQEKHVNQFTDWITSFQGYIFHQMSGQGTVHHIYDQNGTQVI